MLVPFYYLPYYVPVSKSCDTSKIDLSSPITWLVILVMMFSIYFLLLIIIDLTDELFGRKLRRLIRKIRSRKK